jgi:hypothetical protein
MAERSSAPGVDPSWTALRAAFAVIFLASGAALLVYIGSGVSLLLTALGTVAVAAAVGVTVYRRATPPRRRELRRRVAAGAVAGLASTLAYDASRFALIEVTGIAFWPFDIFGIFGQGLFGAQAAGPWVSAAGAAYHAANGIGFAIAFSVILGTRGVIWGVGWGICLEVMMLTVYPGWLDIRAVEELFAVSMLGHVVYGAVLGATARWLLVRGPLRLGRKDG